MSDKIDNTEETWNYTPLSEPIPITEQVWPEGTVPLVCTRTMTYNHENYIRECIEGILMQKTTFPVRVSIHDDASTDKTASIVREYQEKYPNLIWAYYQEENSYRNEKRGEMRREFYTWVNEGKYIALCEGDDYWTDPFKLQKQVDFLEDNQSTSVVVHAARIYLENKQRFNGAVNPYPEDCLVDISEVVMKGGGLFPTNSMVIRREFMTDLPDFFTKYSFGDYSLMIYLAMRGDVYYFNSSMSVYRQGVKNSWTHLNMRKDKVLKHQQELILMLRNFKQLKYKNIDNVLDTRIRKIEFTIALMENDYNELNSIKFMDDYTYYKSQLNTFQEIKHFLRVFKIIK